MNEEEFTMKKTLALLLALVLMMTASVAVFADSPTSGDLNKDTTEDEGEVIFDLSGSLDEQGQAEIEKLKEQGLGYFGEENAEKIKATLELGEDEGNVHVFLPLVISNSAAAHGEDIEKVIEFATLYEEGTKVVVLIGVVKGEEIEWTIIDSEVVEGGKVKVVVSAALAAEVEAGKAYVAIVSK